MWLRAYIVHVTRVDAMTDDAEREAAIRDCHRLYYEAWNDDKDVPVLLRQLDAARAEIEQHHAHSTCCCGNYMTEHGLGDGHSPVSMYDYALDQTQSQHQTARWQIGQQIKVISSESERADRFTERAERAEAALQAWLDLGPGCTCEPESGCAAAIVRERARAVLAEVPK